MTLNASWAAAPDLPRTMVGLTLVRPPSPRGAQGLRPGARAMAGPDPGQPRRCRRLVRTPGMGVTKETASSRAWCRSPLRHAAWPTELPAGNGYPRFADGGAAVGHYVGLAEAVVAVHASGHPPGPEAHQAPILDWSKGGRLWDLSRHDATSVTQTGV